jgi:NADH-quinone oxidoreductase subunit L
MHELFAVKYSWLIPLMPLIGAAISGLLGAKWLKEKSHWPIWLGVGASAVMSLALLAGMVGIWGKIAVEKPTSGEHAAEVSHAAPAANEDSGNQLATNVHWFNWINVGGFSSEAGAWIDPLTCVMLCVVSVIGFFITVFAAGYMHGEAGYFRFFAYLGLFIFMMTCLVMGNNLIMLYLGWEGVGLSSYLLIGYYYERPSAREAAKKAFLVNRVGDFGFGLGIMACYYAFGTITYFSGGPAHNGLLEIAMASNLEAWKETARQWIPFLLMIGAFGKSAQFPLYVWLPDAMEGPTPVSALIHAATMVTAGVYMIVRCGTLFVGNDAAMWTIAVIGAFTALFAATIALRQFDLKKVFAYSTISQLGFMFVGVGCLAPVAGVFHLITHAFFKALLFLSSGVVMHAMAGELDFRKFSGLKRVLPKTRILMLIGCLALAGFPFLSGFFSKDEIIAAAWERNRFLGAVMLFTAFLTAYYTFRLYFRTFEGPEVVPPPPPPNAPMVDAGQTHHDDAHASDHAHGHDHHHNHEPGIMIIPLVVLAIGAVLAGYINWPEKMAEHGLADFLGHSPSIAQTYHLAVNREHEHVDPMAYGQTGIAEAMNHLDPSLSERTGRMHFYLMLASGLIAFTGIYLAYLMHLKYRDEADKLAARHPLVIRVLENKYWVDEIYQAAIVEPLRAIGRVCVAIDTYVIDGIIWIISFVPQAGGFALKLSTQRGYLQGYAVTMVLGVVIVLLFVFL